MTWHKRTVRVVGLALAIGAAACDNGLTDVNRNPNAPETVSPALLFATAAVSTVRQVRSPMELTPSGIALWAQYLAEYQYPEISYYQFRPSTADAWWNTFYSGPLTDLEQALRVTTANSRGNQTGPILVLRAFAYSTMTNMWGDIPFTEATKGDQGIFAPKYDTQQFIYDSLLKDLAGANTMMGASAGTGFGSQDPVYGGDPAQWKKFANSLRARLGMYLSDVDPARAQSEVAAAIAAGGFTSNADNAQINWPGDGVNNNPWWDNQAPPAGQGTRDDARASVTLIDTLKSLSDPRLPVWFRPVQDPTCGTVASCTPVAAGGYRGMPNGLEAGPAGAWGTRASRLSFAVTAADQPSYYMTYAEFSFIKAEAAQRGWIAGGATAAATYYNEGIRASMEQWGVANADIVAYLAQPSVVYNAATGLRQIGLQKWLALFTQGYEGWVEWRRTGFPNLTPAANARTTGGVIPRRITYPQTEQSYNNANLQAAITAQGSDELHRRLWIDP